MPPLRRPSLPPGDLQKLNEALHDLHLAAGWPSVREMESALDKKFSYPVIHDVFSKATRRAPRLDVLLAVVEYLASRVRKLDVEETVDRFDAMWNVAARAALADDGEDALETPSSKATLRTRIEPERVQLRSSSDVGEDAMTDLLTALQRSVEAAKAASGRGEGVTSHSSRRSPADPDAAATGDPGATASGAKDRLAEQRAHEGFVYSSLNTIASLMRTDPGRARQLLIGFAALERAMRERDGTPVNAELAGSTRPKPDDPR